MRGLAHLGARGGGDERRRQAEQGAGVRSAPEFDPGDNVAPLVGAAHLQFAAEASGQLDKVIGLQYEIVEFEKGQRLVAFEAQPHAVLRQHAIDREVPPDIAQQRDVTQFVEPVGVVDHDRVGRASAELQEVGEDLANARHVMGDLGIVEQLARLVAARRVADPGRAAAHQHDRLVAGLLEQAQQHDPGQIADMQAVGGAVVADISGDRPRLEARVERRQIGALMDEAAFGGGGKEIGVGVRHGALI